MAVVLTEDFGQNVYTVLLQLFKNEHIGAATTKAVYQKAQRGWRGEDKDRLIKLLSDAGLTVRFYDPEEKRWMATDTANGPRVVDGDRAGSWGAPTSEEFETDYLKR